MNVSRILGGLLTTVVVGAAAVAVGYAMKARPHAADATAVSVPTGTAAVTRGTVTERIQVAGTLGFDGSYQVVHHAAAGILTSAADLGSTVDRGGTLYTVANAPVRLLIGATPAYRDFAAGMTDGPDVRELEQNMVDLGMDPYHEVTVDDHFTAATATAIRRWQAAWGWPAWQRTGELSQGQVVFLPAVVRVAQAPAAVGAMIGPNSPVLSVSSINRVVTAQVTTDRQALLHQGDPVQVTLPGTAPVPGTVTRIGRVAASTASANGGGSAPPTIPVTIAVTLPSGSPDLDQAPVQVGITTASHPNVLLVPVAALLARPGGGYQVRLSDGGYVPVEPGLFDDSAGKVEVTGAGLAPGQQVEVPAS